MPHPTISLVIPAYNEQELLPRLLRSVELARNAYAGGVHGVEVIVADNDSTDATAHVAREHGARVTAVARRCIGAARNGGAADASGDVVAFVDADSIVHPESFNAIGAAIDDPRVVGGATGVTLERWSLGLALTYATMLPMVWLTGLDTGVVFCRRADFLALGGYDETRLLAEDVHFLWRLRKLGRSRGQRLRRLRGCKTITSTRKFDRYGDWHWFTQMPGMVVRALRSHSGMAELLRRWYGER